MLEKFSGTVLIADGKINVIDITSPDRQLLGIEQVIALKNMLDQYLLSYEKDYKRS